MLEMRFENQHLWQTIFLASLALDFPDRSGLHFPNEQLDWCFAALAFVCLHLRL